MDPYKAMDYLQMLRSVSEPVSGATWILKTEWKELRKDMYKNIALFY